MRLRLTATVRMEAKQSSARAARAPPLSQTATTATWRLRLVAISRPSPHNSRHKPRRPSRPWCVLRHRLLGLPLLCPAHGLVNTYPRGLAGVWRRIDWSHVVQAKAQKARGATTQAAAAQAAMGSASAPIDGAREQVPKGTRKGVNAAAAILRHRRLDLLAAMLSLRRDATRAVIVRGERAAASAQLSEAQADKRIADTCAALAAQAAQRTAEPAGTSPVAASPGGHHDDASTADAHSPKRAGPSGAGAPEDGTACAAHPASARISFPLQHHRPATSAAMAEAPVAVAGESCAACVSAADLAPACAPAASACSGASHGATPQETGSAARLARDFEDAHANAKELAQALQVLSSHPRFHSMCRSCSKCWPRRMRALHAWAVVAG